MMFIDAIEPRTEQYMVEMHIERVAGDFYLYTHKIGPKIVSGSMGAEDLLHLLRYMKVRRKDYKTACNQLLAEGVLDLEILTDMDTSWNS